MVKVSGPAIGIVVVSAALAVGMSACSSSDQPSAHQRTATVMVTVPPPTTTEAPTPTTMSPDPVASTESPPTHSESPSSSPAPSHSPVVTATTPKGPPPTPGGQFDAEWARQAVALILGDIKMIDSVAPQDGSLGQDYTNLSDAYGFLEQAGLPRGADGNAYLGGLERLIGLASDASTATSTDPAGAHAKYLSARQKTQPILDDINAAIGTHYEVPSAPAASTPAA